MEITGFDITEINALIAQLNDSATPDPYDFDAQVEAEKITAPVTKSGDIRQLDKPRLMCGDATKHTDVESLMTRSKADIIFTDPLYKQDRGP